MSPIKIIAIIVFILCNNSVYSQSDFTLGVIVPEASQDFNDVQIKKLEAKLTQIINSSNLATMGYNNDFVLYPIMSIEETSVVEGGMQNLTVTSLDFSLYIKQLSTNIVYNSFAKRIKGSGTNKSQAITNALSQIKINEDGYAKFINTAKVKIVKYYNDNCKSILKKADNLASKQDYEQAISMLQSIPPSTICYNEAEKKSLELYKKYQNILCDKNLMTAKSEIALKYYTAAINALEIIDPASKCAAEVNNLINKISDKVERKEKQQIDMEKYRINAVKEIGKAYYSNSIRLVRYNVIIH